MSLDTDSSKQFLTLFQRPLTDDLLLQTATTD